MSGGRGCAGVEVVKVVARSELGVGALREERYARALESDACCTGRSPIRSSKEASS